VEKKIIEENVEKLVDGEVESSSSEFFAVEKKIVEENVEKLVDGEVESSSSEFSGTMLLSDEDSDDRIEHRIHKENLERDDEEKKDDDDMTYEKKDDDDDHHDDQIHMQNTVLNVHPTISTSVALTPDLQQELYLKIESDLQSKVDDPELWNVLKAKYEKSSASTDSCRIHMQNTVLNVHPTISTSVALTSDLQQELYLKIESDLQSKVDDPELWNVLKAKYEKSSASTDSCRYDAFRIRDHDDHPGDDVPPDGEKSAKSQKMSRSTKSAKVIDEDEVILEDETHELLYEFKNNDKRVPTIFDHERMEATIKDVLSNQFRDVEEYVCHLEQAKNYMENQIRNPNEPPRPYRFSEANFKYLNKNNIEDMYYLRLNKKSQLPGEQVVEFVAYVHQKLCDLGKSLIYLNIKEEKRVIDLVDIPKFCDATLEKVLKELKLKIFVTEFKMKTPLHGELDLNIMKACEREIMKRLKHRKRMRRWKSFVNGRPILQSRARQE
nr:hypothetical protein [Tanacetum cinerariifolium]